ncbi:MAG: lipoprotein insertase outer membrane protein LolB [Chrysiogenales bacterium]
MSIRFNFSDLQGKQNGRIHWRFDRFNAKFLFFTPLNQVSLELDVKGETALLLRPGRKQYWRGDFSFLLDRLWGIELTMEDLKQLLIKGLIPEAKMKEKGIAIDLETDPKDHSPQRVHFRRNDVDLNIKIMQSENRPGSIVFLDYDQRFQPAELEDLLSDD